MFYVGNVAFLVKYRIKVILTFPIIVPVVELRFTEIKIFQVSFLNNAIVQAWISAMALSVLQQKLGINHNDNDCIQSNEDFISVVLGWSPQVQQICSCKQTN